MSGLSTFFHKWLDGAYCVGIVEAGADEIVKSGKLPDIHWIETPDDNTWMADPFIIGADYDTVTLLVEEYVVAQNKGRLSKIAVDRHAWRLISSEPILELPTHLSFPYPVSADGKSFICPETNATDEAALYDFDGKSCTYRGKIITGRMLDTQLLNLDEEGWFAFSVKAKGKGMDDTKTVEIHRALTADGPYTLVQTIEKAKCEGRGAGPVFRLNDGRIIRPAQNCEGGYGKGVILFELNYKDGRFNETEILRLDCDESRHNGLCLHTFSPFGNLTAIDGFDYKNRTIANLGPALYKVKSLINKLIK